MTKKQAWITAIVAVLLLVGLLFWKWPRPILTHFDVEEPFQASVVFLRGQEPIRQIDLDADELQPLWAAIEGTRIRHQGSYDLIYLDDGLYEVVIQMQAENTDAMTQLNFSCDGAGFVYIEDKKYDIVGASALLEVLPTYFDTEV